MNSTFRYILAGLGIILAAFVIWYFIHIVAYILISAVLALIGRPIVELLGNIHIRKIRIPISLRALLAIVFIWGVVFLLFRIFIPLIADEINNLSELDPQQLLISLNEPITKIETIIDRYHIAGENHFSIQEFLTGKALAFFNVTFLSNVISTLVELLGNIFVAFFSITFITFFFLRDQDLFTEGILTLVPDKHVDAFKRAMNSTRRLLVRYFVGVGGQLTEIFVLVVVGLTIIGVGFRHSLLIALVAGFFQIIPYLGPLLGSTIGILMAIATHLDLDYETQLLPMVFWMIIIYLLAHLIDNLIYQPFVFSNRVNAHPLEIFIVLLAAGSLAGIAGMILAIPVYTVIRVFAKEFFNKFKVVKKLTRNIE
jgi:predicted PurR-regulated permease PerM